MISRRKVSTSLGQTTTLAMPVSSLSVMKTTPASPGIWRISTMPAQLAGTPSCGV